MKKYSEVNEVIRWYPSEFKRLDSKDMWKKDKINLYAHIPFCKGKCQFCPFNSMPINRQNLDEYFNTLRKEISMYAEEEYFKSKTIESIWIGGGTPSAVPIEDIKSVLDLIFEKFDIDDECEVTLETNLHDLNEEYIKEVAKTQVNRLSIGVQSFKDKYLKMMGRTYKYENIKTFFSFIRKYDLNISIDLMYRYPGQTLDEIDKEIEFIKENKEYLDHITLYSLILFPKLGTFKQVKAGKLPLQPSFSTYMKMNKRFADRLPEAGFHQYTTNHFAKDGKENVYNNDRWGFPQKECVSFGPGAFGQIKDYVYCNEHAIQDYYDKVNKNIKPVQSGKKMNLMEQASRFLVLGTKCLKVDLKLFEGMTGINPLVFYKDKIDWLLNENMITINDNILELTKKGIALIIDVQNCFQTENNLSYTQPQYDILDMFEGQRETYDLEVIEKDEE